MAMPEAQLSTWSNIGAQAQSKATYATIKAALERQDTGYYGQRRRIFLQGSYGNDTNIWTESDVDIVICHQQAWFRSLESLPVPESNAYNQVHSVPSYDYPQFSAHVHEALERSLAKPYQLAGHPIDLSEPKLCLFPFPARRSELFPGCVIFRRRSL